jgi:hypothetical protein
MRDMSDTTCIAQKPRPKVFRVVFAAGVAALIFLGFIRTQGRGGAPGHFTLAPLYLAQAAVMVLWLAYYVLQVWLAASGRIALHKRIGLYGFGLAGVLALSGSMLAVESARAVDGGTATLEALAIPLGDTAVFSALTLAGFVLREEGGYHKRYMQLAMLGILPSALGQLPLPWGLAQSPYGIFGVADLFILAFVLTDVFRKRRLHPAFVWGFALILLSEPGRCLLARTQHWHRLAAWLTRG